MACSLAILGTRGYPSYYGGFETAVRHIAPYLADQAWSVLVYGRPGATLPNDPTRDPRVETRITHGVDSKSTSTLTFGFTAALHTVIRRPRVILVMNVANGLWIPIMKLAGAKVIVNVDGIEWERQKWGRLARLTFKLGAMLTAWLADELIADSFAIAHRWENDFRRQGHVIAYGGTPTSDTPVPLGLEHRNYILWIARLVPENSIAEFLAILPQMAEEHDVVIVGSSGYEDDVDRAIKRLSEGNSRIHALGHVKDDALLFALWEHAGVYFHGHSVGGTNPSLVQAMHCGAPIIARDTVYNREVLGDAGLFTDVDPSSMLPMIRRALSSPLEMDSLSRRARNRAQAAYTWESVCAAYDRLARQALRQPKNDRTHEGNSEH